ncbi:MAG TPA: transglutaminase domain-containing protein, partial [Propionibacteriaceae bacterium]|nr:transglutaminase domain-containing protein [Propionibacteriaceae bacterium]HBY23451.1 transglutaminase domain-containing protein [Propionibacteriaceae bacterium]
LLGGVVPTGSSLSGLSSVAIGGWKDLLTTLPPVDGTGQLVVLPYLLGLLGGTVGFTVARRTRLPWVALLTPLAVSGVVILLGTRTPAAALPIGIGTAVLAAGWVVVRSRRLSLVTVGGSESAGRRARVITGAALVSVAA